MRKNWNDQIRKERIERRLSQSAAAAIFEVSQNTFYRWEAGLAIPRQRMRDEFLKKWGLDLDSNEDEDPEFIFISQKLKKDPTFFKIVYALAKILD